MSDNDPASPMSSDTCGDRPTDALMLNVVISGCGCCGCAIAMKRELPVESSGGDSHWVVIGVVGGHRPGPATAAADCGDEGCDWRLPVATRKLCAPVVGAVSSPP